MTAGIAQLQGQAYHGVKLFLVPSAIPVGYSLLFKQRIVAPAAKAALHAGIMELPLDKSGADLALVAPTASIRLAIATKRAAAPVTGPFLIRSRVVIPPRPASRPA